eukprot:scaffold2314_cov55-Cyclotella_meneghiniana.AAC.5
MSAILLEGSHIAAYSLPTYPVNGGVWEGISMKLEGSQNRVGRETEWRWKRDGIAEEGSWELVGQWMGLTGNEKALACRIIGGRAVVVGVRENADFPLAQYLPNSWTSCCCGCEGKC